MDVTDYRYVDLAGCIMIDDDMFELMHRVYHDPSIEEDGTQDVFVLLDEGEWHIVGSWPKGPIPIAELEVAVRTVIG